MLGLFKNKVVKNASWIIVCKIVNSILNILVTMISARFLGPANYGLISYASSIVSFFSPVALLGINCVMVQELVNSPEDEGKIIGSSIFMAFLSSLLCMAGVTGFSFIANGDEKTTILVCALYSLVMICQAVELIVYWFQAKFLSKYSSLVSLLAYILVSVYKIVLLINNMSIYLFAVSNALDLLIIALVLYAIYKKKGGAPIKFDKDIAKQILSKSKHYIIPNLMMAVYLHTDTIMLKNMLSDAAAGIYSAAVSCSTFVGFVYVAILDSMRPYVFEKHKKSETDFEKSVVMLYSIVIYFSLFMGIAISLFSNLIVHILYGEAYLEAIPAMLIVAWMPMFSYLGSVRNIWALAQQKQKYLWKINVVGAISNVAINFALIPLWGVCGAAFASVLTQFIINVFVTVVYKPYRPCGRLIVRSLNIFAIIKDLKENKKKI